MRDVESAERDLISAQVDSRETIRQKGELFDVAEADLMGTYKKING